MAIRDVVTRGFGNGTYSPGVSKLPTRGFSIGVTVVVAASQFYDLIGIDDRPAGLVGTSDAFVSAIGTEDRFALIQGG